MKADDVLQKLRQMKPKRKALLAVATLAVVAGLGIATTAAQNAHPAFEKTEPKTEQTQKREHETGEITLDLSDPAFTADSSPALVKLTPKEGDGKPVYAVVAAGDAASATIEAAPGGYDVHVTSPVNADGSIFDIPDTKATVADAKGAGSETDGRKAGAEDSDASAKTDDASTDAQTVKPEKSQVPADQVTDEQRQQIKQEFDEAAKDIESGKAEVSGKADDAKQQIADAKGKAEGNLGKKDEGPSEGTESKDKADDKKSDDGKADSGKSESSSDSSSNPGSGSGSSDGSQSQGSAKPEKKGYWKTIEHPAVTHQETVYRTETVTVTDSPASSKQVAVCAACGYETTSPSAMNNHLNAEHDGGDYDWKTITIPAKTHTETRQVPAGTRTVVDKAAWTERVWVEE